MSEILIIGCGKIGMPLAHSLIADGHQVTGIKRNPQANSTVKLIKADITKPNSLRSVHGHFDYIFIILPPSERSEAGYASTYEQGITRILKHFEALKNHVMIFFVSSTSVYHQNKGEWVDETSQTQPENYNGRYLLNAESKIHAFSENNIVVRFSGIYQSGKSRYIDKLNSELAVQKHPPVYTNRIHRDDCVAVLRFLMDHHRAGNALHSCYLASDDHPVSQWEWLSWLSEEYDTRPLLEKTHALSTQNKQCSNKRLKELGYRFIFPNYRTGYAKALAQ